MRTALPLDTRPINKTSTLNVTPGEYTLEFKGLVAPDMLATYYSCMSDNVSIKVGDTSGRVETTEESFISHY